MQIIFFRKKKERKTNKTPVITKSILTFIKIF